MHQAAPQQLVLQQQQMLQQPQRFCIPRLPRVTQICVSQLPQQQLRAGVAADLHAAGINSSCRTVVNSTSPGLGHIPWAVPGASAAGNSRIVAAKAAGPARGRGPAWRPPKQPPQPQQPPAPSPPAIIDPSNIDSEGLAGMFKSYAQQMQEAMQQPRPAGPSPGANVMVKGVGFHPPGAEDPLLEDVSFHLKPNQLGLIIGRSGSGKTTLLQLLAGLTEQTSGDVFIHRPAAADHTSGLFLPTHIEQRMQQVGGPTYRVTGI